MHEWRPFDHCLRRCLAGLLRGGWVGRRAGFIATALAWIGTLFLTPGADSGWGAGLAPISLVGGLIGGMAGAALGLALANDE